MIPIYKPYLPSQSKYQKYLDSVYNSGWLTNNGPLVQELKLRLEAYLGVKNLLLVANGTLALQVAYKTFKLSGNVITTPFTFIATASSLKWEGIVPSFGDIDRDTLNLCPFESNKLISEQTSAIVPVHVYGNPCEVLAFEKIGRQENIKIIYDAAHAFGVQLNNRSILNYGDASTLSFHATKIFHSVEGGAVIFKNENDYKRASKIINFGIGEQGEIAETGINAKMSEFHAAMGLAMLDDIDVILAQRVKHHQLYKSLLKEHLQIPTWHENASQNGAYFPVIFESKDMCSRVLAALNENNIGVRRYFSPSLSRLEIFSSKNDYSTHTSDDYAERCLCLPLFFELTSKDIETICRLVKNNLS